MSGGAQNRATRRAEAAVALRVAGASYEDIAQTLGYRSAATVAVQVEKALARTINPINRDQQRDLAGRRLERLIRSAWPKAINPESPEHLPAVRTVKDLIDRHSRLYGLDAPAEIVVHTPTTAEIEQWVASVLTTAVADVVEADVVDDVEVEAITALDAGQRVPDIKPEPEPVPELEPVAEVLPPDEPEEPEYVAPVDF